MHIVSTDRLSQPRMLEAEIVLLRHQLSVLRQRVPSKPKLTVTDWDEAPDHLFRDRDASYGSAVTKHLAAMGIRDHPIAPWSTGQNGHAERLMARSAGSALITSSSWARPICAGSLRPTPATTTNCGRIYRWVRIRCALGQSNASASSLLSQSSADFIMNTDGPSVQQGQFWFQRVP